MLLIDRFDENRNFRILKNDRQLFHNALKHVLYGEQRFHVKNEGAPDFDLVYVDNDKRSKSDDSFPDSGFYRDQMMFPPYFFYDEDRTDKINLDLLEGFDEIFFEEVNEYSIVIARLALKHTKLRVTFKDERIFLMPDLSPKIKLSDKPVTENRLYAQKKYYSVFTEKNNYCIMGLFHSLFLLQGFGPLPEKGARYLELTIRKTEGIGSILSIYRRARNALGKLGIEVYLEPGSIRYDEEMISKYFQIGGKPEDATEENTIFVKGFNSFVLNHFMLRNDGTVDINMLKPSFVKEMKEYADSILADKKVLGVLLRGTDVVLANYSDDFRPVPVDDCISYIKEMDRENSYDKIFVATEDALFLESMKDAFPNRILAVAQERFRVSDFGNAHYISELEKNRNAGSAYRASVEDTTVNYYYAMYILSRCESFVANCMCNGVNLACAFREEPFEKKVILSQILNK